MKLIVKIGAALVGVLLAASFAVTQLGILEVNFTCGREIKIASYKLCVSDKILDGPDDQAYIEIYLGVRVIPGLYRRFSNCKGDVRCDIAVYNLSHSTSPGAVVLNKASDEDITLGIDGKSWRLKIPESFQSGLVLK